jgi:lipopolysaccharide transport system ATP-binding protein
MSAPAIRVTNLSKCYRLAKRDAAYSTLREALSRPVLRRARRGNGRGHSDELWALRQVDFEAQPGEAIGIIGRNGAGKSTLLKILSRITEPTHGRVEMRGRVGSLLEIGTGFHPELTGRENIFLNGAILGMHKAEIARKFDEIVAFAELEKFIDTPVKRYSSGMYMRLAFAVAAHLETEILFVDEVLAVGDAVFQRRCLGKMGAAAREGRTVLFVSHNMEAIAATTQRGLVLSQGRCVYQGPTLAALAQYQQEVKSVGLTHVEVCDASEPKITKVELRTTYPNNVQVHGEPLQIEIEITSPVAINGASLSIVICSAWKQPASHLWTFDSERAMCRRPGVFRLVCRMPKLHLYTGHYSLTAYFSERPGGVRFQALEGLCPFDVVMYGRNNEFGWHPDACTYLEDCEWTIHDTGEGGPWT